VRREFSACKRFLESFLAQEIVSASMPGGDWNELIVSCAKEAGLRTLCASRPGINKPESSIFNLRRVAIHKTTSASDIRRYCSYNVRKELMRSAIFQILHRLLGMKKYSILRRWLLGEQINGTDELFKP
jgi:hypothetical protein